MSKIVSLILVVVAVWWLAKGFRRKEPARDAAEVAPEQMVKCDYCGLYLPQGEAIVGANTFFCCTEHRRRAG